MGVEHVVWDWNGTLLDDNHAVISAVNAVCVAFGRDELTLAEWQDLFRRPLLECYERVLGRTLSMADWAEIERVYHGVYRPLVPSCGLYAGTPELLHGWRGTGRTQSLLSMWFHHELVPLVTELGIAEYFARVDGLVVDLGGGSKAGHLHDHLVAQQLDPATVLVIGDVADDAYAAAEVGAACVLVTTGVSSRAVLERAGVPVVDSIAEAVAIAA